MRFVWPLFFALLIAGCATSEDVIEDYESRIDSLRAEKEMVAAERDALTDSLHFYDDVASGQHARTMRVLRDDLNRMYYELNVWRDGGRTLSTIRADDLFEPASATLHERGMNRLTSVADYLRQVYSGRSIRIEGHSDSTPLSEALQEQYPSNWELSSARAAAVARYLIEEYDVDPERLTVVGYGATRPVASNDTAAGRRENRRVRIALLPDKQDFSRPDTTW